jgi:hypothetical protein
MIEQKSSGVAFALERGQSQGLMTLPGTLTRSPLLHLSQTTGLFAQPLEGPSFLCLSHLFLRPQLQFPSQAVLEALTKARTPLSSMCNEGNSRAFCGIVFFMLSSPVDHKPPDLDPQHLLSSGRHLIQVCKTTESVHCPNMGALYFLMVFSIRKLEYSLFML